MSDKYSKFYEKIESFSNEKKEEHVLKPKNNNESYSSVSDFFGSIISCTIIGYVIDSIFSKHFLFTVVLFFLGIASGINLIVKRITKK